MTVRYSTEFGIQGDGVTNDTTALQSALTAVATAGHNLLLKGTILIDPDTVTVPDFSSSDHTPVRVFGGATIKARGTGTWLLAGATYANSSSSMGNPFDWSDIVFDGDNKVDHVFINRSFSSRWQRCYFKGALVDTFVHTFGTASGSNLGTAASNCKWIDCRFDAASGGTQTGALFKTPQVATGAPADGWMVNCAFAGTAGCAYCMDIYSSGGWIITGNHTYRGTTADVYIRRHAKGGAFANNTIENEFHIGAASENRAALVGPGNTFWSDIHIATDDDDDFESVSIIGNSFTHDPTNTTASRIHHETSRSNKRLIVSGNAIRSDDPYVEAGTGARIIDPGTNWSGLTGAFLPVRNMDWQLGNDADLMVTDGNIQVSRADATWLGRFFSGLPGPYVQFGTTDPTVGEFLMSHRFYGDDTIYAFVGVQPTDLTGGSEGAHWSVWTKQSGADTMDLRAGGGVMVGFPTLGLLGQGTLNATALYVNGVGWFTHDGTPEGSITAIKGALCSDITNGELYLKTGAYGNTGWKLVTHA